MSDVIDDLHDEIERLRAELQQSRLNHLTTLSELQDAAEQSRRLRAALRLAAIDVFAQCDPLTTSPDQLVQHYIDEGRR